MEIYPKYEGEPWQQRLLDVCMRVGVWAGAVLLSVVVLGSLWGWVRGDSVGEIVVSVGETILWVVSAAVIIGVAVFGVNRLEKYCEKRGWLKP